ncbi:reverse transcriptase domain-containing protein [Tanacetum coccineum]
MAELDSFFLFKWPVLEPLGFVPWGTLSAFEEGLGALKTTGLAAEQIANMWSVKEVGIEKETLECSRAVAKYQNLARRATSLLVLKKISLRLNLTCFDSAKGMGLAVMKGGMGLCDLSLFTFTLEELITANWKYLASGRHLEEIHVTLAYLEKKQTRLQTNTKILEDLCSQSLETASPILHDVVTTHLVTASQPFMTACAARTSCLGAPREKAINSFDEDDLAFQCMIRFRKFTAYFDPFLPMNIITQKAYNTIMVEGLESTGKNLVAVVRDVYVFVGSFTYITNFVDYLAAHTERMKRFENAIFKQREEINEKRKKKNDIYDVETGDDSKGNDKPDMEVEIKEVETMNRAKNGAKNMPIKKVEKEEVVEAHGSRPVNYYLKHRINEELIGGLVDNNRFNASLSRARVGKVKGKTYNVSPRGPVYEAVLKKKITKKEDIGGNFKLPCGIGCLKHVNALVDQGSDVNIMPYSTYVKLTDERPAETDIRLSLASHSYIYPLGIAEDILVEVAKHVYPMEFIILDIKEDERRPFILGTPFLTTAKAMIKFDKGTITLRSGKSKISFHRILESLGRIERGVKNDIEPLAPTMTVNRLVLE